jgi:hypothetical protein
MGARYYLTDVKASDGKLVAQDTVRVDEDRVTIGWYLCDGERPAIHSYAKGGGYIALRYQGELFQLTSNKAHFGGSA